MDSILAENRGLSPLFSAKMGTVYYYFSKKNTNGSIFNNPMMNPPKNWYETWFNEHYIKVYSNRNNAEAKSMVDLTEEHIGSLQDKQILDLGCGFGRHSILMAQKKAIVTALDISASLLNVAKENAYSADVEITLIRKNMLEIDFYNQFDLICSFFTSFGYFSLDSEHLLLLEKINYALRQGGNFILDFLNDEYVKKNLQAETNETVDNLNIYSRREIKNGRVEKHIKISDTNNFKKYDYFESVRLLSAKDIEKLLHQSGFHIDMVFGDYQGSCFTKESPRLLIFATKKN